MIFILPTGMDVLMPRKPVANICLSVLITVFFLLDRFGTIPFNDHLVLQGWDHQLSFFTLVLRHGDYAHWFFNIMALLVFGNAVNSKLGNLKYIFLFLLFSYVSSAVQLLFYPDLKVIGASGAICGVTAFYFSLYPKNYINYFFWILFYWGFKRMPGYFLAIIYVVSEIWGAMTSTGNVAYGCHLGGFAIGVGAAFIFLKYRLVEFRIIDKDHIFSKYFGRVNIDEVSPQMILAARSLKRNFRVKMGSITEQTVNGITLANMMESKRLNASSLVYDAQEEDWISLGELLSSIDVTELPAEEDEVNLDDEQYFLHQNGDNIGPYKISDLKQIAAEGQIDADQLIYKKLENSWCRMSDLN